MRPTANRAVAPILGGVLTIAYSFCALAQTKQATMDDDGVYHLPAFDMPQSEFISEQSKKLLVQQLKKQKASVAGRSEASFDLDTKEAILKMRHEADAYTKTRVEEMLMMFPVSVVPQAIGGVQTDVVTPKAGIPKTNQDRVLVNLHGGGMIFGARYEGQLASIPIAAVGGFKVITVDYRMAPEYHFPAASEGVAKVYSELLKQYPPKNIGFYGCSAGAHLTTNAIAWFENHHLPIPGAISLEGGGGAMIGGDSYYWAGAFFAGIPPYPPTGTDFISQLGKLYPGDADPQQALLSPALHSEVLKGFPPTLVLNATRDPTMSSAVYTHAQLVKAGVAADLHIWDGMGHCFSYDAHFPESRELYTVLTRFFDVRLGQSEKDVGN